jgi:GH24 family phage-related lysozyme (muramidase)
MIDFNFIEQLEGNVCQGYVPDPKGSNSGVTIACGFDLGQRDSADLKRLFSAELAEKLLPYAGLKKHQAQQALQQNLLKITQTENSEINKQCKREASDKLQNQWQSSKAHVDFSKLSSTCQTVVASVAFQYGNLATRTPNFWQQITSGNWHDAVNNLRNFGDAYSTRRNQEADLLSKWLQQTKDSP